MAFTDRELACRDCGGPFIFTAGEQEFYATKGLQHDPVRCPSCRSQRKAMRPEDRDETPRFGVYSSWGGRTPRQLHVASCNQCARMTEVPFVPRGDRPVYCSDCYNDIRRKQEAQQQAEEEAALSRMSAAAGRTSDPLESDAAVAVAAMTEPGVATESVVESDGAAEATVDTEQPEASANAPQVPEASLEAETEAASESESEQS